MKTKLSLTAITMMCFVACASPEQRAVNQTDTNTVSPADTAGTDTITNVNGRSGDNGTGTDTTNTTEQKAVLESGQ